jgi:hypothetical protein
VVQNLLDGVVNPNLLSNPRQWGTIFDRENIDVAVLVGVVKSIFQMIVTQDKLMVIPSLFACTFVSDCIEPLREEIRAQ